MFRLAAACALVALTVAEDPIASTSSFAVPDRIKVLDEECFSKTDSVRAIKNLEDDFKATSDKMAETMADGKDGITKDQDTLKESIDQTMQTVEENTNKVLDDLEKELTETKEALEAQVSDSIKNLTDAVAKSLQMYEAAKTMANDTSSHKWTRNYALVQVAKAPANTENGHAGRMMYKIEFNPNNPGFWYPSRDELINGCRELSKDLKEQDGIDRDLKPAADVDWASDGNSVRLQGSYLSNCGCGGRPRQRQCVGMSRNFLAGGAMYNRYHSWWGCLMLRHDGRDCHHHWSHCYASWGVKADYTICTSANDNYKV